MTNETKCRRDRIAAFLDGELDAAATGRLELHLRVCRPCNSELQAQQLFMCALDSAMSRTPDLPVPHNFSKMVAARAESDMRGVRERVERKRAFWFCVILAFSSFTLLGAAASKAVILNGEARVAKIIGVFEFLWTAFRDATVGLTVISRVVSGGLIPETPFVGLVALLLCLGIVLLSLLISSYHQHHEVQLSE